MSFFRMLLVLALCLPLAYLAMRLLIGLIDQLLQSRRVKKRGGHTTAYRRNHGKRSVHNRRGY